MILCKRLWLVDKLPDVGSEHNSRGVTLTGRKGPNFAAVGLTCNLYVWMEECVCCDQSCFVTMLGRLLLRHTLGQDPTVPALVHVGKVWQHQDFSGTTHLFFP